MNRIFRVTPIVLIAIFLGINSFGQVKQTRSCATDQYMQQQILKDPSTLSRMDAIEKHIQNYINNPSNSAKNNSIITIPVVFHVVYNNSTQNISDLQLQSQIDVLNEDFAALNSDISTVPSAFQGLIGNSQIQFCLASKDPSGNPSTGIIRVSTSTTSFGSNNAIKFTSQGGSNAWPASDYLNFWVGNLSGSLLGYAQFPGGSASTDGVVCLYTSIGRPPFNPFTGVFNLGRTATHEVGHWLNLRHIWGDSNCGNDFVADTPTQQTSNGGCPNFPHVTCSNGPNGDMFMNYMDYVYDACMVMFSAGQAARMNATFSVGGPRESLLSSNGCGTTGQCQTPPTPGTVSANPSTVCTGTMVTLDLSGSSGGIGETYQWQQSSNNINWTNIPAAVGIPYGIVVSTSTYFRCEVTCGQSTVPTPSILVTANNGSISSFPHTENFDGVTAPVLPCGWTVEDVNSDGFSVYNGTVNPNSGANCATYSWNTNTTTAADDWMFTPPVQMTGGYNYVITFSYRARSATYTESLEINWGNAANSSAMTGGIIFSDNSISNTSYSVGTSTIISPASTGNYYFGFHVNSAADQFDIHIDDVTITESISCGSPPVGGTINGPSNFEAGPGGGNYGLTGYNGNIQWQLSIFLSGPYSNISGADLPAIDLISSSPGTYYLRAELSLPGCSTTYSNVFTFIVSPRTGDNMNKPIPITGSSFSYTDSTFANAGFTNQNGGQTNAQTSAEVYFSITTDACTDRLDINTCSSLFDTYIHLLDSAGNHIISNDDNGPFCSGSGLPGSLSESVQPNTTYFVVVEGWTNSTGIFTIDIDERVDNPLAVTTSKQDVSCNGINDGSVSVIVSGGYGPYSFIWSTYPAQTVSLLSSLSAGTYTSVISDSKGCIKVASATITSPIALIANTSISHPTGTSASDGSIAITVSGGTAPYQYLWSNGNTTEDLVGLTEGVYYCHITDANGCAILVVETLIDNGSINNSNSKLNGSNPGDLLIYPNPANDQMNVEIRSELTEQAKLIISDMNSRVMHADVLNIFKGINSIDFNVSKFPSGVYFLHVVSTNKSQIKKFLIH